MCLHPFYKVVYKVVSLTNHTGQAAVDEELGRLLQGVAFAALESHQEGELWAARPAFVVMYDPDIAFIRQLEARLPSSTCPMPTQLSRDNLCRTWM